MDPAGLMTRDDGGVLQDPDNQPAPPAGAFKAYWSERQERLSHIPEAHSGRTPQLRPHGELDEMEVLRDSEDDFWSFVCLTTPTPRVMPVLVSSDYRKAAATTASLKKGRESGVDDMLQCAAGRL